MILQTHSLKGAFRTAWKTLLAALSLAIVLGSLQAQAATVRILWIGNSMMYWKDLPGKVKTVLQAAGHTVEYQQETPGGWYLTQHAAAGSAARTRIKNGYNGNDWNYVIVNGFTMEPATQYSGMLAAARTLKTDADTYNPGCQFIFHTTNPYRPDMVASLSNYIYATTNAMADDIGGKYVAMAQAMGVKYGPNTQAMKRFYTDAYKTIDTIWEPADGKHHTNFTHCMAAYLYASMITGTDPIAFTENLGLSVAGASYAKVVAKEALEDSNQGYAWGSSFYPMNGWTYSLKATANEAIVCAENAGATPLVANRTSAGDWEKFVLVVNPDATLSFRAKANGRYVTTDLNQSTKLIAGAVSIQTWEKFAWVPFPDGKVALVSMANNSYVCTDLNLGAVIYGNRSSASNWETFTLTPTAP